MKTLHFTATIAARPEVVWRTMLAQGTYRDWTSAFAEGSSYEGSWQEGERIVFGLSDGDGMLAVIAESRPHEFISIKHIGQIKDGVEDTNSEEVRRWTPAFENYTFQAVGASSTELKIDMDSNPAYEQFMQEAWPKALARLKVLCEAGHPA